MRNAKCGRLARYADESHVRSNYQQEPAHKHSAFRIPHSAFLFIATLILACWVGNLIIKQFIASSLLAAGELSESSALALTYAPANPHVQVAYGKHLLYQADLPRAAEGLAALERATAASPHDYRFWLELARGYENDNQTAPAERAYEQARALAPRYFETHWAIANFYLRGGRTEESLREFRVALELSGESAGATDTHAALNAYEAVSQAFGLNLQALRQIAPADAHAQAALAQYLAEHQALDPALETWRALLPEAQNNSREALASLLAATQQTGRYQDARALWRTFVLHTGALDWPPQNLIYNGGFERELITDPAGFDWQPVTHSEVFLRRDDMQARAGRYTLRLTFAAQMKSELQGPAQLIAVEPNTAYRLRFFAKTAKVPDRAPFVEITDAARPQLFAVRAPVPSGTNEWREVALTFTTPAETHALRLTIRAPQLLEVNTGHIAEVWLDEFRLEQSAAQ